MRFQPIEIRVNFSVTKPVGLPKGFQLLRGRKVNKRRCIYIVMNAMTERELIKELKAIRKDSAYIKEHMVDIDAILTPEEEKILEEGIKEFKDGKTIKLEDLERDCGEF
jgi:hypothetical protein